MIDVVLITFNRIEFTKITIDNILDRGGVDVRFILADAGSTDGTQEYLKTRFKNNHGTIFSFADMPTPLAYNLNRVARFIESDPFITTSEDQICYENDFLKKLINVLMKAEDYWAIRPRLHKEDIQKNERLKKRFDKENMILPSSSMLCNFRACRLKVLKKFNYLFDGGRTGQRESRGFSSKLGRDKHGVAPDVEWIDLGELPGRGYTQKDKGLDPRYIKLIDKYLETGNWALWESQWREQLEE